MYLTVNVKAVVTENSKSLQLLAAHIKRRPNSVL